MPQGREEGEEIMRFLPKEICEKLIEMGCKNQCFFYWYKDLYDYPIVDKSNYKEEFPEHYIPAFSLEDFVGTHEQAKENAKIIWSGVEAISDDPLDGNGPKWLLNRHELIDSDDWVEYITNFLNGKQ